MRFKKSILGAALAAIAATTVLGSAIAQTPSVVPGDPAATPSTPATPATPVTKPDAGARRGDPGRHEAHRGERGGPERFERRMEHRIARMVEKVGGTAEQKDRIVAIMKASMADGAQLRKQERDIRGRIAELLKAPTIDRAAIEQQRGQLMALRDQQSQRMTRAMADSAEVLTPEQRVKFAELRERGPRGGPGHHHRGHGGPRGHGPGPDAAPPAKG